MPSAIDRRRGARRRRTRADRRRLGARSPDGPADSKDIDLEVFGLPADRAAGAARRRSAASRRSARAFRSTSSADIDVSLPRRESKAGRGHRGFVVDRRSRHVDRRGGAPPRLHGQRDRVGSADRRVPRSVRRPRAISTRAPAARRRSARPSATTACACCARCSSPRGSTSRSTTQTRALCRAIPLDDLPAERVWGEFEKLLFAPRPSIGFALAMDLGIVARLFPELQALVGLRAGARVASGRRRLGAHAAGDRPGAHAHRRSAAAAADRRDARRRLPRSRQTGDDGVHRRPHPIDGSRGAGRRADAGASRSAERPLDRRLRRARAGARASPRSI